MKKNITFILLFMVQILINPAVHAEGLSSNPQYYSIRPALVVNVKENNALGFLQVKLDVMSSNPDAIDAVRNNQSLVRDRLILFLSELDADKLHTAEDKQKIRDGALVAVNEALEVATGTGGIEAILITDFVVE